MRTESRVLSARRIFQDVEEQADREPGLLA